MMKCYLKERPPAALSIQLAQDMLQEYAKRFSVPNKDGRYAVQDGYLEEQPLPAPTIHLTQDMLQENAQAFSPSMKMPNITNKIMCQLRIGPALETKLIVYSRCHSKYFNYDQP